MYIFEYIFWRMCYMCMEACVYICMAVKLCVYVYLHVFMKTYVSVCFFFLEASVCCVWSLF